MLSSTKILKKIEKFLTDKDLKCLTISCSNQLERETIKSFIQRSLSSKYNLEPLDERVISNKSKNKFLIFEFSYYEMPIDKSWN